MIVNHIWIQFHSIGQTAIVLLVAFPFMGYNIFLCKHNHHISHLILCNDSFDQSLQPIFGSNSIQIGQTVEVQDSKYFLHSCICTLYIFFEKSAYFCISKFSLKSNSAFNCSHDGGRKAVSEVERFSSEYHIFLWRTKR